MQSKIKLLAKYDKKLSALDLLWLIKVLKKAIAEIDTKADPQSILIDLLYGLFRMRQGLTEPNDSYLERLKSNISTVELAHGKHIFCSIDLMTKASSVPTETEIAE